MRRNAVRFRRGFMLGDGTGAGKGRQSAGIILDNWLQGRRKAVWISKSDKLIEDAQRDWSALGMERLLVTPLSRFPQGKPITLSEGVLFTTYATLRSDDRGEKVSRVKQIVEWLGSDFDGVIIFDESHAMQNAGGGKGERGDVAASQQGRAGLRLQHALPNARVVYVSATGATTVHNLAYAQRLGLWGGEDFPFATRAEFVEAIEAGGVAAMEVLARDLRALGLYTARSLSYDGVEYELVEHQLTPSRRASTTPMPGPSPSSTTISTRRWRPPTSPARAGTLNRQAKSAARSAFESAKQRFFGHLLTSMKTPTLIRSIERDLEAGHAAVIQIVSTGEALMERRLAEIPTEEWNDVRSTSRRANMCSTISPIPSRCSSTSRSPTARATCRRGRSSATASRSKPRSRRAARRDDRAARLAAAGPRRARPDRPALRHGHGGRGHGPLAPHRPQGRRLGGDALPSRTARLGQSRRDRRPSWMTKRILIFSDAGGTGRSYHAELSARNQRLRVHYLLEPGWKADAAIQGSAAPTAPTRRSRRCSGRSRPT
jgi:hypothetical protein